MLVSCLLVNSLHVSHTSHTRNVVAVNSHGIVVYIRHIRPILTCSVYIHTSYIVRRSQVKASVRHCDTDSDRRVTWIIGKTMSVAMEGIFLIGANMFNLPFWSNIHHLLEIITSYCDLLSSLHLRDSFSFDRSRVWCQVCTKAACNDFQVGSEQ